MQNIIIAKITSVHGIKGLVKIMSFAANPSDIAKYSAKMFDSKDQPYKIKIINQIPSANNDVFVVEVDGIKDRNAAEGLRNTELFIKKSDLKKAKKDEFYYVDLVGLDVLDPQNKKIGKVDAINDFGAGALVEITFTDEKYNKSQINNFNFTNAVFPEVNIEKGYLIFDMPEIIEVKEDE